MGGMKRSEVRLPLHREGEVPKPINKCKEPLVVDTHRRRFHVEWDSQAPVTPLGQLVFFSQFLAAAALFTNWVKSCPLRFTSPNAPAVVDLLGTIVLAILAGQRRYAHVTGLRADTVNPQGLGMGKVCSEDSVRRAFRNVDRHDCARWQQEALEATWLPALQLPWVLDIDVTVKPIYGHQEGAEVGYNPHKPGRPSHAYHSLFIRELRLVLDVEVRPGKQHSGTYSRSVLWNLWDRLPKDRRPWLICGDSGYGNEKLMAECEEREQQYLFRQRQTKGVKQLIRLLESKGGWTSTTSGWSAIEGRLQLAGWTAKRRIVILRRERAKPARVSCKPLPLPLPGVEVDPKPVYEYQVLVTNLKEEPLSIAHLYAQRADAENNYDELKNQWGWGGFTTRDQLRCQVAARNVALVYNWWSLFVRAAHPEKSREAITSRPLLLCAVGRIVSSGRQQVLRLTSTHGEAERVQGLLSDLSLFLSGLLNTAEQLNPAQRWERIWVRILKPWLPTEVALPGPSG